MHRSLLVKRVDSLRKKTVSCSSPPAPPPTPFAADSTDTDSVQSSPSALHVARSVVEEIMAATVDTKRAPSRCHECHGPISGYHNDHPHGLNICQLEHYDYCEGGLLEGKNKSGHYWRSCPSEYVFEPQEELYQGQRHYSRSVSASSSCSQDPSYKPGVSLSPLSGEKVTTRSSTSAQAPSLLSEHLNTNPSNKSDYHTVLGSDVFSSLNNPSKAGGKSNELEQERRKRLQKQTAEDLMLEAELAELAVLKERESKMEQVRKSRLEKQKLQENLDRLARQEQGEGGRPKHSFHDRVDTIRAQSQVNDRSSRRPSVYRGPTMDTIRRDEKTKEKVDREMGSIRDIPALSNARPDLNQRRGVPRLKSSYQPALNDDEDRSQYHRQDNHHATSNRYGDRPASPDMPKNSEDVLYKWVTRCDRYGEQYRTLVEHVVPKPLPLRHRTVVDTEPGWVYDHQSGRAYQSSPQRERLSQHLPSLGVGSYQERQSYELARTPTRYSRGLAAAEDRVPGIVSLDRRQAEEREGKVTTLVDHAKNLPVEFAKSATAKNMNFALWVYAIASELHSSLIGITPPLERGVLEAKLQHIMNVVHVTCLNSNAAEYKPVSWQVGRTYHHLIQAKVDSGREHWADFDALYRGSPHAAEMVSAEREHRAALAKPVGVGKRDEPNPKIGKKPQCTTWNISDVEGKCKYEAEHPGEKCNRQHSCSYCDKKGFTRNHHQETFCKRKPDGEK